jgi:hypothetical protein
LCFIQKPVPNAAPIPIKLNIPSISTISSM